VSAFPGRGAARNLRRSRAPRHPDPGASATVCNWPPCPARERGAAPEPRFGRSGGIKIVLVTGRLSGMSAEVIGRHMPPVPSLDDLTAMMTADQYGHRYEISPEGALSIMPPPGYAHATIATRIMLWLAAAGITADRLSQAVGLRIPGRDGAVGGRIPDLVIWSQAQRDAVWLPVTDVLLVIEIVSPGSVGADTVDKVSEYAGAGIPRYWTVSQDGPQTVTMYHLVGDRYQVTASTPLAWVLNTAVAEHLDLD